MPILEVAPADVHGEEGGGAIPPRVAPQGRPAVAGLEGQAPAPSSTPTPSGSIVCSGTGAESARINVVGDPEAAATTPPARSSPWAITILSGLSGLQGSAGTPEQI